MLFAGGEIERIGWWGSKEGDICCDGLEKELELVVWWRRSYEKRW